MKTATGLALIAIGAILAFAVTAHPAFFDIQVAGWVILLIGIAGLFVPRSGYGWLRRRMIVTWNPRSRRSLEDVEEGRYPAPYLALGPGNSEVVQETRVTTDESPTVPEMPADQVAAETSRNGRQPNEQVVEEYYEE
jgi:hypothetical protein